MKILFIQTNYPDFLKQHYKNIDTKNKSYFELKKLWAKQLFGSSDFYLQNLKSYGWEGDEIIANDTNTQMAWAKEHNFKIKIKSFFFTNFIPVRIKNLLGLNQNHKKIVSEQIKFYKPDVVYIHDVTYFTENELQRIKNQTKLLVGQIAYPKPLNQNILKSYDLLISSLPNFINDFRKMGIKTEYLKWCFEETILKTIGKRKRIYDVTYIGGLSQLHSKGNRILDKISKQVDIHIWGYGRPNIKPAWGKKMYEIFSQSKIVINRHINLSKNYANNMRMYDATGMGALLITDDKVNMEEFFDINQEVVTYKNADDLVNKIRYYLMHDKIREKIAKAGQLKTLKKHTYKLRMKELDKILRNYL